MSSQDSSAAGRGLQGVQGWLLVLCLYLLILVPLLALLGLYGAWQGASRSPTLQNALAFEAAFEFALALFGFYAGLSLLQKRAGAVVIAKLYFIVMLTLGVLVMGIVLLGLVSQFSDPALARQLRGPATVAALRQIILCGLWLLYLERSARIRATYP